MLMDLKVAFKSRVGIAQSVEHSSGAQEMVVLSRANSCLQVCGRV